jgi:hypothetical protein
MSGSERRYKTMGSAGHPVGPSGSILQLITPGAADRHIGLSAIFRGRADASAVQEWSAANSFPWADPTSGQLLRPTGKRQVARTPGSLNFRVGFLNIEAWPGHVAGLRLPALVTSVRWSAMFSLTGPCLAAASRSEGQPLLSCFAPVEPCTELPCFSLHGDATVHHTPDFGDPWLGLPSPEEQVRRHIASQLK